jgi:hypothetical protein
VDVLVEVERRDDHHRERILDGRPSQRTPAQAKRQASTLAAGARRQAKRDSR